MDFRTFNELFDFTEIPVSVFTTKQNTFTEEIKHLIIVCRNFDH